MRRTPRWKCSVSVTAASRPRRDSVSGDWNWRTDEPNFGKKPGDHCREPTGRGDVGSPTRRRTDRDARGVGLPRQNSNFGRRDPDLDPRGAAARGTGVHRLRRWRRDVEDDRPLGGPRDTHRDYPLGDRKPDGPLPGVHGRCCNDRQMDHEGQQEKIGCRSRERSVFFW